ncbi:PREDICTED: X antigen family member 2-like [Mandrillus leucophaeus]|uniref:X antigen family member 2-like n=1 Tax=Mandrillus leucophaeus TaxID=9568 RepID=UPI0005F43E6C|nr:PREDICTED: X antigen family member 2-like [Mandrillus leucophaeus]
MSWRGRSTYRPRPRRSLQPPELIVAMLEPSDEEPKEEKPPTESWDPTADQKREDDQVAAEIQVPDLEADLQELCQSKTGDECEDGTDVKGKILPKAEHFKMPEASALFIKTQSYVISTFYMLYF